MPNFYLMHSDNTFSDFGNYSEKPEDRPDGEWIEGSPHIPVYQPKSPLEQITEAVKQIPLEKRTSPVFGTFMSQCLLAIDHNDNEALGYLFNTFETQDSDYLSLITNAKAVFGLT